MTIKLNFEDGIIKSVEVTNSFEFREVVEHLGNILVVFNNPNKKTGVNKKKKK